MGMASGDSPPGRDGAREALASIGAARHRLGQVTPPQWLHWGLGLLMVVQGLAQLLGERERMMVQALMLVSVFALSFAAQRRSGVVARLRRPPARPLATWIAFTAIVVGALLLTSVAEHAGQGPLGFFGLAILIVTIGPRLRLPGWRSG